MVNKLGFLSEPFTWLCSVHAIRRDQARHVCLSVLEFVCTQCKRSRITHEHAVCTGGGSFLDSK